MRSVPHCQLAPFLFRGFGTWLPFHRIDSRGFAARPVILRRHPEAHLILQRSPSSRSVMAHTTFGARSMPWAMTARRPAGGGNVRRSDERDRSSVRPVRLCGLCDCADRAVDQVVARSASSLCAPPPSLAGKSLSAVWGPLRGGWRGHAIQTVSLDCLHRRNLTSPICKGLIIAPCLGW